MYSTTAVCHVPQLTDVFDTDVFDVELFYMVNNSDISIWGNPHKKQVYVIEVLIHTRLASSKPGIVHPAVVVHLALLFRKSVCNADRHLLTEYKFYLKCDMRL